MHWSTDSGRLKAACLALNEACFGNSKIAGPIQPDELSVLTRADSSVFDDPVVLSSARTFLNDPRHHLAVAMMGGRPVGFVSAVHYEHPDKPAPELWINEVGVVDACQGRGVGTRLMQAMLEHGRALGCTEAWVTTHPDNEAANALYAKLTDVKAEETRMYTFKLAAGDDR